MEGADGTSINTNHLASTWRAKVKKKESIKKKRCKERRGLEKLQEITVVIKNQLCNQTYVKYIRIHLIGLCRGRFSLKKSIYLDVLDILSFGPTHFNQFFQSTLYKFIVLGYLGPSPSFLGWAPNLVLTVVSSILVSYAIHNISKNRLFYLRRFLNLIL